MLNVAPVQPDPAYWKYPADVLASVDTGKVLSEVTRELDRYEGEWATDWERAHAEWAERWKVAAMAGMDDSPIDPFWLCYQLDEALPDDAIVCNTPSPSYRAQMDVWDGFGAAADDPSDLQTTINEAIEAVEEGQLALLDVRIAGDAASRDPLKPIVACKTSVRMQHPPPARCTRWMRVSAVSGDDSVRIIRRSTRGKDLPGGGEIATESVIEDGRGTYTVVAALTAVLSS